MAWRNLVQRVKEGLGFTPPEKKSKPEPRGTGFTVFHTQHTKGLGTNTFVVGEIDTGDPLAVERARNLIMQQSAAQKRRLEEIAATEWQAPHVEIVDTPPVPYDRMSMVQPVDTGDIPLDEFLLKNGLKLLAAYPVRGTYMEKPEGEELVAIYEMTYEGLLCRGQDNEVIHLGRPSSRDETSQAHLEYAHALKVSDRLSDDSLAITIEAPLEWGDEPIYRLSDIDHPKMERDVPGYLYLGKLAKGGMGLLLRYYSLIDKRLEVGKLPHIERPSTMDDEEFARYYASAESALMREIDAYEEFQGPEFLTKTMHGRIPSGELLMMTCYCSHTAYQVLDEGVRKFLKWVEAAKTGDKVGHNPLNAYAYIICEGLRKPLEALHKKGVANRDVKLDNVLFNKRGFSENPVGDFDPKMVDLGILARYDESRVVDMASCTPGDTEIEPYLLKPYADLYMAVPEVCRVEDEVHADIWGKSSAMKSAFLYALESLDKESVIREYPNFEWSKTFVKGFGQNDYAALVDMLRQHLKEAQFVSKLNRLVGKQYGQESIFSEDMIDVMFEGFNPRTLRPDSDEYMVEVTAGNPFVCSTVDTEVKPSKEKDLTFELNYGGAKDVNKTLTAALLNSIEAIKEEHGRGNLYLSVDNVEGSLVLTDLMSLKHAKRTQWKDLDVNSSEPELWLTYFDMYAARGHVDVKSLIKKKESLAAESISAPQPKRNVAKEELEELKDVIEVEQKVLSYLMEGARLDFEEESAYASAAYAGLEEVAKVLGVDLERFKRAEWDRMCDEYISLIAEPYDIEAKIDSAMEDGKSEGEKHNKAIRENEPVTKLLDMHARNMGKIRDANGAQNVFDADIITLLERMSTYRRDRIDYKSKTTKKEVEGDYTDHVAEAAEVGYKYDAEESDPGKGKFAFSRRFNGSLHQRVITNLGQRKKVNGKTKIVSYTHIEETQDGIVETLQEILGRESPTRAYVQDVVEDDGPKNYVSLSLTSGGSLVTAEIDGGAPKKLKIPVPEEGTEQVVHEELKGVVDCETPLDVAAEVPEENEPVTPELLEEGGTMAYQFPEQEPPSLADLADKIGKKNKTVGYVSPANTESADRRNPLKNVVLPDDYDTIRESVPPGSQEGKVTGNYRPPVLAEPERASLDAALAEDKWDLPDADKVDKVIERASSPDHTAPVITYDPGDEANDDAVTTQLDSRPPQAEDTLDTVVGVQPDEDEETRRSRLLAMDLDSVSGTADYNRDTGKSDGVPVPKHILNKILDDVKPDTSKGSKPLKVGKRGVIKHVSVEVPSYKKKD